MKLDLPVRSFRILYLNTGLRIASRPSWGGCGPANPVLVVVLWGWGVKARVAGLVKRERLEPRNTRTTRRAGRTGRENDWSLNSQTKILVRFLVTPAQAGVQGPSERAWIPACAGMTGMVAAFD